MPGVDLSDYVEVAERVEMFRQKHPSGSLQVRFVDVPPPFNEHFIAVEARAYRTPDDERPGIDIAWEPVPGKTPYTADSEAMNASTSAVGRAIVYALAADAHRSIASANEVRARRTDDDEKPAISPKQMDFFSSLLKKNGVDGDEMQLLTAYAQDNLSGGREGSMSSAIDLLKKDPGRYLERLRDAAVKWDREQSVVGPAPDDMDLPPLTDLTDD